MDRPCRHCALPTALAAALAIGLTAGSASALAATPLETHTIADPQYGNMPAAQMRAPAGWKFQGSMSRMCTGIPSASGVATSADGRFQTVLEPNLTWKWIDGMAFQQPPGCLPLRQAMRAQDFLVRFVQSIDNRGPMKIVGTMPVDGAYQQAARASYNQLSVAMSGNNSISGMHSYPLVDVGAIRVQTQQGEERYRATVTCFMNSSVGAVGMHMPETCSASVDIVRAPHGQLDALARYVDANQLEAPRTNPAWMAQVQGTQNQIANAATQRMTDEHNRFMNQMQREGDARNARFNAQMVQRSRNTADVVNYALDRQTYSGANGTYNTYNGNANYSWSNGQGGTYGTNDPNANPGAGWTQDQRVHGDGTPYGH